MADTRIRETLAASFVSFGVSIVLTPIMSRLYGPSEYGVFAVINGVATVGASAAQMSLPNALACNLSAGVRWRLTREISLLSVLGTLLMTAALAVFVSRQPADSPWGHRWIIVAGPMLMLTICVYRIALAWSVALGSFHRQVWARVAYALTTRPLVIALGLILSPLSWLMVVGETGAFIAQVAILTIGTVRKGARRLLRRKSRGFVDAISQHRTFTMFDFPSQLLVLASQAVPAILVAWRFGPRAAGHLSLGFSLLSIPIQLISIAIAPALLYEVRSSWGEGRREAAIKLSRASLLLLGTAALGYGFVMTTAPWLVPGFLGEQWAETAVFVRWLCVPLALQFVSTPFLPIFWYSGHVQYKLALDICGFAATVVVLALAAVARTPADAIMAWAAVLTVQRLTEGVLLLIAALQRRKQLA